MNDPQDSEFDTALTRYAVECALGRNVEETHQRVLMLYAKAKHPLLRLSPDGSVEVISEMKDD